MKTILITGSTDGIGKLVAIKLANKGHEIYLHGRNSEKLAKVISEVKQASNNENIKGFVADFSDLDAVSKMAERINNEIPKIDILINNAGVFNSSIATNKDGLDLRIVVNYLAPYVLTNLISPLIKKAENSRIINLSSAAQDPINIDMLKQGYQTSERISYGQSKLALTMWSFYLAKQLTNSTIIAVNPGSLLDTKMAKEAFGQIWSPADKGVNILYDLATSDDYKNDSGKYFDNDQGSFANAHPDAYNQTIIQDLITATNSLLGF